MGIVAAGYTQVGFLAAFAAGLISFVSPCVLPLVPGYLSTISGVSFHEIRDGRQTSRVLAPALLFCLSFTTMFVALGLTASSLGALLSEHRLALDRIAGGALVVMGLLMSAAVVAPRFVPEWRPARGRAYAGAGGPLVAGLAFAVAWTPCVGPTLGAVLTLAANSDSAGRGGLLLACYSLGLAVPFLILAVAFERTTGGFRWMRDRYRVVTMVGGVVLVLVGVLVATGNFTKLAIESQQLLETLGLDVASSV